MIGLHGDPLPKSLAEAMHGHLNHNRRRIDVKTACGAQHDVFHYFRSSSKLTVLLSIWSFNRFELLKCNLRHLSLMDVVDSIHIVWHKPTDPIPADFILHGKFVRFHQAQYDSLNNRFVPPPNIGTNAVLVLDDDIFVHEHDVNALFQAWRLNQAKIVGFFPRWLYRTWYSTYNNNQTYEAILTKAMVLSKQYLLDYTCNLNERVRRVVSMYRNCEDIAMNFVLASVGESSLFVSPKFQIHDIGAYLTGSLFKANGHIETRSRCLRAFNRFTKTFPRSSYYFVDAADNNTLVSTSSESFQHAPGNAFTDLKYLSCNQTLLFSTTRPQTTISEKRGEEPSSTHIVLVHIFRYGCQIAIICVLIRVLRLSHRRISRKGCLILRNK